MKLIQLGAKWCGPCNRSKPLVKAACEELGIEFEYVDLDKIEDPLVILYPATKGNKSIPMFESTLKIPRVYLAE